MKFHVLLAILCLSGVSALSAQQKLTFDVVSVKENRSGTASAPSVVLTPRGVTFTRVTPLRLIEWAYDLYPRQVLGGPPWIRDTRFDVQMIAVEGTPSSAFREMTKAMLRERFGLLVSVEVAQRPIYKLQLAHSDRRLGPSLKSSEIECDAKTVAGYTPPLGGCGVNLASNDTGLVAMSARRVTMADLARVLTQLRSIDRMVFDHTGLSGEYQFSLLPDIDGQVNAAAAGAALFTALQDQLGLKLVSAVGPVTVLHIQEIVRPSEN